MDADLNHEPEELKRLPDAFEAENAGIITGRAKLPGSETHNMGRLAEIR
jgi:hypothetical protein